MNDIKEVMYLRDLKTFLNQLTEDQLVQPIRIEFDESPFVFARKIVIAEKDYFINKFDNDDGGTMEDIIGGLEEGQEFDATDYIVVQPAGTIYLTN